MALQAVVFDLDGVVTRTAHLHVASWGQVFDTFLRSRAERTGEPFLPFDPQADYRAYVDGKPRLEGVRSFLASRAISLPEGTPEDAPETETLWGIGNRKNALFRELVEREGVQLDAAAVALLQGLRAAGVRVGVASSSRNTGAILRRAGLEALFDACVDGVISAQLGLRGKPSPDIFLACLARLGPVPPAHAAVLEDAAAGVSAGKAGGFGLVVGVDRGGNWLRLREAGADWLVKELGAVSVERLQHQLEARTYALPNALTSWPDVRKRLQGRRLAVFLDYDGTLTPIVSRPELALLAEDTREALRQLAEAWPTFVISGRGLEDVQRLVGLDSLWYSGSHGFDIAGPRGRTLRHTVAPELAPEVHRASEALRARTAHVPGALVEDKRFSVAVHYRLVPGEQVAELERAVDDVLAGHPLLRKAHGKKVFELRPALDWDKGRALRWLLEALGLADALPVYVGDDTTDEDAFRAVAEDGLGILVAEVPRPTAARASLQEPEEVRVLLERLAALAKGNGR